MIEFFFDCSSPWTYLPFHNIQLLAKEFGAEISWRPILVGGIFNTINPSVYASREAPVEAKINYQKKDMADWARTAGLAIKMQRTGFRVNGCKAMMGRAVLFKESRAVRSVLEVAPGSGAGPPPPRRAAAAPAAFAGAGRAVARRQSESKSQSQS